MEIEKLQQAHGSRREIGTDPDHHRSSVPLNRGTFPPSTIFRPSFLFRVQEMPARGGEIVPPAVLPGLAKYNDFDIMLSISRRVLSSTPPQVRRLFYLLHLPVLFGVLIGACNAMFAQFTSLDLDLIHVFRAARSPAPAAAEQATGRSSFFGRKTASNNSNNSEPSGATPAKKLERSTSTTSLRSAPPARYGNVDIILDHFCSLLTIFGAVCAPGGHLLAVVRVIVTVAVMVLGGGGWWWLVVGGGRWVVVVWQLRHHSGPFVTRLSSSSTPPPLCRHTMVPMLLFMGVPCMLDIILDHFSRRF